jgi:hypothetical protein
MIPPLIFDVPTLSLSACPALIKKGGIYFSNLGHFEGIDSSFRYEEKVPLIQGMYTIIYMSVKIVSQL